jgi:hypothetical protein
VNCSVERIPQVIEPEEIIEKTGSCNPHTTHCLASHEVMVSMLGDANGNAKGSFVLIDSDTLEVKGIDDISLQLWFQIIIIDVLICARLITNVR